jgi:hypothetical protein
VTDPPRLRQPLLASTSSKIAIVLFAVIVLASISMALAAVRKGTNPGPRVSAVTSPRTRAMPALANPHRAALAPGQREQIALQVTSLQPGGLITGRVVQPLTPTTVARTDRTVTVKLTPGATTQMGSSADIKPGALLQASGSADNKGTLRANSVVVLTGYIELQAGGR